MAKDIVHHFLNRGYQGKAMVVSNNKQLGCGVKVKITDHERLGQRTEGGT